jgi:hypothetical protein
VIEPHGARFEADEGEQPQPVVAREEPLDVAVVLDVKKSHDVFGD